MPKPFGICGERVRLVKPIRHSDPRAPEQLLFNGSARFLVASMCRFYQSAIVLPGLGFVIFFSQHAREVVATRLPSLQSRGDMIYELLVCRDFPIREVFNVEIARADVALRVRRNAVLKVGKIFMP